jgi:hypothetical protein
MRQISWKFDERRKTKDTAEQETLPNNRHCWDYCSQCEKLDNAIQNTLQKFRRGHVHFILSAIASPQLEGSPFPSSISATFSTSVGLQLHLRNRNFCPHSAISSPQLFKQMLFRNCISAHMKSQFLSEVRNILKECYSASTGTYPQSIAEVRIKRVFIS